MITTKPFNGVYVKYDGQDAILGFSTKPQEARARFLLDMKRGDGAFELTETPHFKTIGPMLDVSRGKVMTVEAVKRFMDQIQKLGLNMLMLYTEDLFELKEYPQFGYQRGRYSLDELRELDRYAVELGIELIPCIQTFGHLDKFLRTPEGRKLKDNTSVIMAGEEATYDFIEAELKAIRSAFTTDRIHLGMDETFGLGRGNYMDKHGYRDPEDIYQEHLARVLKISEKYFKNAMIWSDMIFHQNGKNYDMEHPLNQSIVDKTPNVDLVFWEYGKESYDYYKAIIDDHNRFKGNTAFGGGIWSWNGLIPNFDFTLKTTKPALEACIDGGVQTVIATMWVSGGAGADYDQALPGLAAFSEYCYKGKACTDADIFAAANHLAGLNEPLARAISAVYLGMRSASGISNALVYGEPLMDHLHSDIDFAQAAATYTEAKQTINRYPDYKHHDFYDLFYTIAIEKATLFSALYPAYRSGDRQKLQELTDRIPALLETYRRFYKAFKSLWRKDYKPYGIENYTLLFGGAMQRLEDVQETLQLYLNGQLPAIGELEEERIPFTHSNWRAAASFMACNQ